MSMKATSRHEIENKIKDLFKIKFDLTFLSEEILLNNINRLLEIYVYFIDANQFTRLTEEVSKDYKPSVCIPTDIISHDIAKKHLKKYEKTIRDKRLHIIIKKFIEDKYHIKLNSLLIEILSKVCKINNRFNIIDDMLDFIIVPKSKSSKLVKKIMAIRPVQFNPNTLKTRIDILKIINKDEKIEFKQSDCLCTWMYIKRFDIYFDVKVLKAVAYQDKKGLPIMIVNREYEGIFELYEDYTSGQYTHFILKEKYMSLNDQNNMFSIDDLEFNDEYFNSMIVMSFDLETYNIDAFKNLNKLESRIAYSSMKSDVAYQCVCIFYKAKLNELVNKEQGHQRVNVNEFKEALKFPGNTKFASLNSCLSQVELPLKNHITIDNMNSAIHNTIYNRVVIVLDTFDFTNLSYNQVYYGANKWNGDDDKRIKGYRVEYIGSRKKILLFADLDRSKCNIEGNTLKYHIIEITNDDSELLDIVSFLNKSKRVGVLMSLLKLLIDQRKEVKKEMKKHKEGTFYYTLYDQQQLAYKVLANSIYAGVTTVSRFMINKLSNFITSKDCQVIYSDTDSALFMIQQEKLESIIKEYADKFLNSKSLDDYTSVLHSFYEELTFEEATKICNDFNKLNEQDEDASMFQKIFERKVLYEVYDYHKLAEYMNSLGLNNLLDEMIDLALSGSDKDKVYIFCENAKVPENKTEVATISTKMAYKQFKNYCWDMMNITQQDIRKATQQILALSITFYSYISISESHYVVKELPKSIKNFSREIYNVLDKFVLESTYENFNILDKKIENIPKFKAVVRDD
ncbi:2330_t:CDS:10, partial [Scutellospora calospora]